MLKRIQLTNFRSCQSTTFSLQSSLSTLVGPNGVGKTNLLRAIEWLAKSSITPSAIEFRSTGIASKKTKQVLAISVHVELDSKLFVYTLDFTLPSMKSQESGVLQERLLIRQNGQRAVPIFRRLGERIIFSEKRPTMRVSGLTSSIAALSSLLPTSDPIQNYVRSISAFFATVSYYSLVDNTAPEDDMVREGTYLEWRNTHVSKGDSTSSVAFRVVSMFIEDKPTYEEFQTLIGPNGLGLVQHCHVMNFELAEDDIEKPTHPDRDALGLGQKLYVPLFVPPPNMGGAGAFVFSKLSAGTRRAIQIVISLLFDKRSLMLIEQPEDSIHPGLLRKLIGLLRTYSDRCQILFTTQSPEVLDILRPEEVILVTAQAGCTNARRLTATEMSRAKKFLLDEGTLSEFLEPLGGDL